MSKLITNTVRHTAGSADNITLDNSQNVTCEGNLTVDGTTTLTGAVTLPAGTTSDTLSFRNKIINGAMQIHQRTGTSTAANGYTLDRWKADSSNDGAWTIAQSTTAPDGFSNSLKIDCTTADASLAASQYAQLNYKIEAQDLQDLAFGTSSAKSITLSFWVRSNKTGDFNVAIGQTDNSDKQVGAVYTINIADTWEKKTMTWAGDTSGVINNDNGRGFQISWGLAYGTTYTSGTSRSTWTAYADADFGAGQVVNIMDNTANEWLISGVQLEVGSTATDFEHRSYGDELLRCQRYYQQLGGTVTSELFMTGTGNGTTTVTGFYKAPVSFRTVPSYSYSALGDINIYDFGAGSSLGSPTSSTVNASSTSLDWVYINNSGMSATTAGAVQIIRADSTSSARIKLSAEL